MDTVTYQHRIVSTAQSEVRRQPHIEWKAFVVIIALGLVGFLASASPAPCRPGTLTGAGGSPTLTPPPATGSPKKVLILYSYEPELLAVSLVDRGLRAAFQADPTLTIETYTEYMDLNRFSSEPYHQQLRDLYRLKYAQQFFDVVVVGGPPAFDFALQYGDELFPGVPMVAIAIQSADLASRAPPPNVTGVVGTLDFAGTLEVALRLHPKTQNVVVIAGGRPDDQAYLHAAQPALQPYGSRVALTYLTDVTMTDLLDQVSHLPPRTVIFYLRFTQDRAGNTFYPNEAAGLIAQTANVPVYGVLDTHFGTGMVGGHLHSVEAQGSTGGEIVRRILHGEAAETIPFTDEGTKAYLFDWRQLKRWGISESALPPGSVVRYKELTAWERYRWQFLGAGTLIVAEAGLIGALLLNLTRRRRAEAALRTSEARFRSVFATVSDAIFISTVTDGRIIECNNRLSGYTREEMIGRTALELGLWANPADRQRFVGEVQSQGHIEDLEAVFRRRDGTTFIGSASTTLITMADQVYLLSVIRDITARKEMEAALRKSEERFSKAFRTSPVMLTLARLADGHLVEVNDAFEQHMGYSRDEVIGRTTLELGLWANPADRARLVPILHAEKRLHNQELEFRTKSGSLIVCSYSAELIELDGEPYSLASTENITERKRVERELAQSREQLRNLAEYLQAAREQERTAIAREIHDEFGQALTVLKMDMAWLSRHLHEPAELPAKIETIVSLIDDTIRTVRRIATELRPGLLDDLGLVAAIEWQTQDFARRTGLTYTLRLGDHDLALDPDLDTALFRILQESLTNIARHAEATHVEVELDDQPARLTLVVRDNGKGIEPEQGRAAHSLGLMGMRERARVWRGDVTVAGVTGQGTTVTVQIPQPAARVHTLEKRP